LERENASLNEQLAELKAALEAKNGAEDVKMEDVRKKESD